MTPVVDGDALEDPGQTTTRLSIRATSRSAPPRGARPGAVPQASSASSPAARPEQPSAASGSRRVPRPAAQAIGPDGDPVHGMPALTPALPDPGQDTTQRD